MPLRSSSFTCLYTSMTLVWSITSSPSGLWREAASFARKRLGPTPMEHTIHSPISVRKRRLICRPMSSTVPLKRQRVSVRSMTELTVTKAWLRQVIVALVLICRGSYRGVVEFLRDLLGVSISVGCVHDVLQARHPVHLLID